MRTVTYTLFFLLLIMQICFAQWFWQNPLPQGNHLASVKFISSTVGWAVGSGGTILRTTDGGINWMQQSSGKTNSLEDVFFSDANNGTAVGIGNNMGIILRTTNGGMTWTSQPSGTSQALFGISFTDANNGTAVGDFGTILRTTNGGTTWNSQSSGTTDILYSVCFTDANNGTAVGGGFFLGTSIILRTTNSGTTWISQSSGITKCLLGVSFTDLNHGTAVGRDGTILRTINGGTTWISQSSGTTNDLSSILFTDVNKGMVVGSNGTILRTTNGGTTWISQSSGTTNNLSSVSFADLNNGTAVGEFGLILTTSNGGMTWTLQSKSSAQQNLNALTFIDANNGIVVGDSGTILKTYNGGTDWTPIPSGTMKDFSAICFTDANNGWAVAINKYDDIRPFDSSLVMHTTNGGTTWTTQIKVPTSKLYDVSFVNANIGIVVGGGMDSLGHIYSIFLRTTNGGLTWNQQTIDTMETLIKVCFFDVNNAWIIESATGGWHNKKIHRTTDGGTNWYLQLETPYYWEYFSDISFADLNNGIAVGGEFSNIGWKTGLIAKTTDGGETWVKQYISGFPDYEFDFIDVLFITNSIITVLGDDGQVLYWTTDGGINWTLRAIGTSQNLNRLFFTDEFTGWAVGDNGTILHTTNGGVTFIEEEQIAEVPTEFFLSQNYPNPFNPSTVIKFSILKSSQVTLKVFNTLGEEIETFVNEEKAVGTYEINWNAANLPSGVYYYRLQAGEFMSVKKMILLK